MKKRNKLILLLCGVIFCFSMTFVVVRSQEQYWYQQGVYKERRQHIFCELLKPGMDKQTVLETIEQFGTFVYSYQDLPPYDADFEIFGRYDDPNVIGENEHITLEFRNGKYFDTFDIYHLDYVSICHP